MSILTLFALACLGWVIWFLIELIRYVITGEYETDKRLRNIGR
jgi:hypothetical protein